MKKFLKTVFYTATDDTTYRKQVTSSLGAVLILIILMVLFDWLSQYIGKVAGFLMASSFFIILIILLILWIKTDQIRENKEVKKMRKGGYKFKHPSIKIPFGDIENWIINSKEPNIIYVRSFDSKIYIIEVVFDITGKNGKWYNKQLWFNETNTKDSEELISLIKENNLVDMDDNVEVCATFAMGEPEYFLKVLEDLKKQKGLD